MANRKALVQVAGALNQLPDADGLYVPQAAVFKEQGSDPATGADEGALYTKDVSGTTQLYYRPNSSGTPVQLGGSAGASESLEQSWVDMFSAKYGIGTTAAGSYTTGAAYVFKRRVVVTGIRFMWAGAAAETIRASLFRFTDGTRLATVDVSTTGAGIYVATFAAPYTILASDVAQILTTGIWQTAGTLYTRYTGGGMGEAGVTTPFPIARSALVKENPIRFVLGDGAPSGNSATEWYAVEPVLDPTLV